MNLAFTKTGQSENQRTLTPRQGPAMIDNIPALAWSCPPDGTTEFLNQPWLDYKALSLDEALGRRCTSAIHPEDFAKANEYLAGPARLGESQKSKRPGEFSWRSQCRARSLSR